MAEELIGIIGGTGLGQALLDNLYKTKPENVDTPFGKPSSAVFIGTLGKRKIAFINRHGPEHIYTPSSVPYQANIFALKQLGVKTLIASGAVGSLQEKFTPGDIVLADQFIDKTYKRQSSFFEDYGAVHCEFAQPTCGRLRKQLVDCSIGLDLRTHPQGTYVCMEGPQFSTRAESMMHRNWGAHLIGMTALPEAKLAREAQMCYALIALVSDYDCWQEHHKDASKQTLLKEIISNLQKATDNSLKLLETFLASDQNYNDDDCPCRKSLELAVWTKPEAVKASMKEKVKVLFE